MAQVLDAEFWQRFAKSSGVAGIVAFLLICFAASLGGRFDWQVFALSFAGLVICWARTWVLLPIHERHENAKDAMWQRFVESDWRFVNALSGLSGTEIDALRETFRHADDAAAREQIRNHFPNLDAKETQEFLRFFNDEFMDTISAYIDENGRLKSMD